MRWSIELRRYGGDGTRKLAMSEHTSVFAPAHRVLELWENVFLLLFPHAGSLEDKCWYDSAHLEIVSQYLAIDCTQMSIQSAN